jgi:hypothetical protein
VKPRMGRALKVKTSQFAANVLPIIREIQSAGHTSCNAIAGQLKPERLRLPEAVAGHTFKYGKSSIERRGLNPRSTTGAALRSVP